MRNINLNVLSAADNQSTTGTQIDSNQLVSASFQAYFGDAQAAGTFKLQASNDPYNDRPMAVPSGFAATNWVDIPNQTASITSGGSALLTIANMAYRWIRALYTTTGTGAQTVAPIADTGVKQIQTVTSVADVGVKEATDITAVDDVAGSLNSTYFTFSAMNTGGAAQTNYYVWYDNGGGVDPAPPGKTGIHVTYTNNDAAAALATASATAITSIAGAKVTCTPSTTHILITDRFMGNSTNAADGAAPTGFAFSTTTPGVASNLLNKYFTLSSVNVTSKAQKNFYMWFNVNSEGTDPALAGKTAIPIAIAAAASANTIATAMRSALNALTNDFTAAGSNAAVIITDVVFGAVTPAVDGAAATGFTFGSATTGVTSNLNNKYFLLQDEASANSYYVWMNVDGVGTDPLVASRTAVPIAFTSGASAGTIGTDLANAIAALNSTNSFTTSGTTTVTVTNKTAGPFVPMSDGTAATGFAFAVTAGGSTTINVTMNALSI